MRFQNAIVAIADQNPGLCSDGLYDAAHINQDPTAFAWFRKEFFTPAFADQVTDALIELASRRTHEVDSFQLKSRAEARSGRFVRNGAAIVALLLTGFDMTVSPGSVSPRFGRRIDMKPHPVWLDRQRKESSK